MTAKKSTTAAARKRAAAARAEKAKRTIKFRGLELTLPKEMPSDVAFNYVDLVEGDVDVLRGSIRLVKSIIGEEQFGIVREKLKADGVPLKKLDDELGKLVDMTFEMFGVDAGK